jgi:hypothetical protein
VFLHRGIAARQFQRSFVLADGVEVTGAAMENGLLHVDLAGLCRTRSSGPLRSGRGRRMNEKFDFGTEDAERIVYVRPVAVADLPQDVREQAMGLDTLYAVHERRWQRLALVKDRSLAFVLARQNDLAPVSVH